MNIKKEIERMEGALADEKKTLQEMISGNNKFYASEVLFQAGEVMRAEEYLVKLKRNI